MKKPTDKQRLDFIQKNEVEISCDISDAAGKEKWLAIGPYVGDEWKPTCRQAIDSAMRQGGKDK